MALTPADWGDGYKSNEYAEDSRPVYYQLDASCKYQLVDPPPSLTGQMTRNVNLPVAGDATKYLASGTTTVSVFTTPAGALNYLTSARADTKRCPTSYVQDQDVPNKGLHEIPFTDFTGAVDQVYAEEGQREGNDDILNPYIYLVATKGSVVLTAFAYGETGQTEAQTEARARHALTVMAAKLSRQ
ncbi:hypothetical protein GCM10018790_11330 [Kitasatospora xanthocidica]|nr:hypothetical protein GCM10018790_11330 [Kitasatospora xanthocidica]